MTISKINTRPALLARAIHGITGTDMDRCTDAAHAAARGVDVTLDVLEEVGHDEDGPLYRFNLSKQSEPAEMHFDLPKRDRWAPLMAFLLIAIPFALGVALGYLLHG